MKWFLFLFRSVLLSLPSQPTDACLLPSSLCHFLSPLIFLFQSHFIPLVQSCRAFLVSQTDISYTLSKGFRCLNVEQLLLGNLSQEPFWAVGSMNVSPHGRPGMNRKSFWATAQLSLGHMSEEAVSITKYSYMSSMIIQESFLEVIHNGLSHS